MIVRVEAIWGAARAEGPLPVGHGLLRGELRLREDGGPPATLEAAHQQIVGIEHV